MPRTHIKELWHLLVSPVPGRQKPMDAQDLLTNQFNLVGKPQVPARDPDSNNKVDRSLAMTSEVVLWLLCSWVYTHFCTTHL